ncbi:putative DIS3-like exonuclease 2 [Cocos nucifera]|uniref:DIS3-like exonuclease 2 n=1 Tax=Cocos nucifera TaxID=13894 RepID=A0A8K0N1K0_COCNU|nr:putative DIS3-like exonuclease 2 [Cocos nucifera]
MDSVCGQPPEWAENWKGGGGGGGVKVRLQKASDVGFSSLPAMHINDEGDAGGMTARFVAGGEICRSCPLPSTTSPSEAPVDGTAPRNTAKLYFSPYWSERAVEDAIEKGNAFKATFRVNAHNRLEKAGVNEYLDFQMLQAYCTIDGVPVDVLINGVAAQNRAIEGDIVAVMLDPVTSWTRLKGSNVPSNPILADDSKVLSEPREVVGNKCVGKEPVDANCCCQTYHNGLSRYQFNDNGGTSEVAQGTTGNGHGFSDRKCINALESSNAQTFEQGESARALERIHAMINSYPSKRPTGRVLSIIRMSPRRGTIIGFLTCKKWQPEGEGYGNLVNGQVSKKKKNLSDEDYIQLTPTDPKFPKMLIEGDIVAVMLDPVTSWTRLKGSNVPSNPILADDSKVLSEPREVVGNKCVGKEPVDANCCCQTYHNGLSRYQFNDNGGTSEVAQGTTGNGHGFSDRKCINALESSNAQTFEQGESARALERIHAMINSYPSKRPTGRVLSIIRMSPRRGTIIGFLTCKKWQPEGEGYGNLVNGQVSKKKKNLSDEDYIQLTPTDPKFPKMLVAVGGLPDSVRERLKNGDGTVDKELVAAQIDEWNEESLCPQAHVLHILGRGGEIEPQIGAILFENAICVANFSPESLACLPDVPWKIPVKEFETRHDLRNICTFTIDPSSAIDLDDALSVEKKSEDIFRIGVHIADVSYFVLPDTALDTEAQIRSTSVYILQHKLPMLPPKLSEEVGSLIPGADRLAFSIIWDIDCFGNIRDRWIGRSIIQSCCKLSYDLAQDIIDGSFDEDQVSLLGSLGPQLHGQFKWKDVFESLRSLHEISKKLRDIRFKGGALWLETAKLVFLFDECGTPYDSFLNERKQSCSLVEEFMLLANRSVAEVISRAFPDCALLRRHPEPNLRKLKEFEAFCSKHGFELDTSSSGQLHLSLSKIREKLKNDPVLFDILISYASRPMQSAAYFCTGDLKGRENDWAHYALSFPLYTHFTSPLRRYPDIIVHRTLSAILDAEDNYLKKKQNLPGAYKGEASGSEIATRCFTGLYFDKDAAESEEGSQILSDAALKFKVPVTEVLAEVAAYCNERKLASRHAEEAGEKVYLWALLKKKKVLVSEARVLGLGPRFLSVYIHKLAIERRIYYDEVEGLTVEWFETTCTLVLDIPRNRPFQRRGSPGKFRAIEDVALVLNPSELVVPETAKKTTEVGCDTASLTSSLADNDEIYPTVFPLVLRQLSAVPVAVHAIGGCCRQEGYEQSTWYHFLDQMIQVKARKMGLQVLQDSMNKVGLLHIGVMIVYSYRAVESEGRPLLLLAIVNIDLRTKPHFLEGGLRCGFGWLWAWVGLRA